ncbi:MAG: c-type cytochrome [Desulfobacteraceae bacterium]|nr:c-type cytochrome [Desulfobacteraceae bacterium]
MFEGFYDFLDNALGYTHPLHPTMVNMPIGLSVAALVFSLGAVVLKKDQLRVSAYHSLLLALAFVFPTVLAAVMDWFEFYGGAWLFPIKVKVGLAAFLFLVLILGTAVARRPGRSTALVLVCCLAVVNVTALGYFGAEIVFGNRAPRGTPFKEGQRIFLHNCTGCHPYGGNILKPKMAIIGSDKLDSQKTFIDWIRKPKAPMPPFLPSDISDVQAGKLYEYLASLWKKKP